jgi:hypothetical protein
MYKSRWTIAFLMFVVIAINASCAVQESNKYTSIKAASQIRTEVLALDYNNLMLANDFISLDEAKCATGEYEYLKTYAEVAEAREGCNIVDRPISWREYGTLIGWRMPNGEVVITRRSLMLPLDKYIRLNNAVPRSGPDMYPELLTKEGYADFCALSPADQIVHYRCIVNPITGKYYDSFSNPQWVYGGVNVEIVDGADEIQRRFKEYAAMPVVVNVKTGATAPCNRLLVITFYGETPGSVIWQWVSPQVIQDVE